MNPAVIDNSTDAWSGCYDGGWQGEIVPEAFSHPAKFSRALIRRIFDHAFAEGWLERGSVCVDPFGGVALGGLEAGVRGVQWVGCELEPKFVALGNANIDLWQRRYSNLKGWTRPVLLQGDSRNLAQIVGQAGMVCGSPPYAMETSGQLGAMKEGEAPRQVYVCECGWEGVTKPLDGLCPACGSSGSIILTTVVGNPLKEGEAPACVIGSPPFSGTEQPCASQSAGLKDYHAFTRGDGTKRDSLHAGDTTGQLSAMPEGNAAAVIGSPPYADQQVGTGGEGRTGWRGYMDHGGGLRSAPEQMASMPTDTFWSAAAAIVAQCRMILRPGGHAIWVTKRFVRNKAIVEFSDQWQSLCEAQGFRLVCRHRAMLVAYHGEQDDMLGETKVLTTEKKSFFRRLAERKGSPRIDHEDVICMERLFA